MSLSRRLAGRPANISNRDVSKMRAKSLHTATSDTASYPGSAFRSTSRRRQLLAVTIVLTWAALKGQPTPTRRAALGAREHVASVIHRRSAPRTANSTTASSAADGRRRQARAASASSSMGSRARKRGRRRRRPRAKHWCDRQSSRLRWYQWFLPRRRPSRSS